MAERLLLEVVDLRVGFRTDDGPCRRCAASTSPWTAGEVLAVVGESGSGKSVTAMSLLSCCRPPPP
jgi:ABC-type dipeptide/oligopeptide/nickel transport system ATPase component